MYHATEILNWNSIERWWHYIISMFISLKAMCWNKPYYSTVNSQMEKKLSATHMTWNPFVHSLPKCYIHTWKGDKNVWIKYFILHASSRLIDTKNTEKTFKKKESIKTHKRTRTLMQPYNYDSHIHEEERLWCRGIWFSLQNLQRKFWLRNIIYNIATQLFLYLYMRYTVQCIVYTRMMIGLFPSNFIPYNDSASVEMLNLFDKCFIIENERDGESERN